MNFRSRAYAALMLVSASSVIPLWCAAQATPAGTSLPDTSLVEIYGGYGYFRPVNSDIYSQNYDSLPAGVVTGVTGYFNRSYGLQAEYSHFFNYPDYCLSTVQGGPVYRHQIGRLIPFAHIIGGGAQVGPAYDHSGATNACTWCLAATAGVGVDYVLPTASLGNHIAIRPIEADFHFSDVNYGVRNPPLSLTGGDGKITAIRLSAGIVYRFGAMSPALPADFGCEVEPVTVFPGDPITVSGRVINLEESRRLTPVYTWTSNGGHISSSAGGGATITTAGLAEGDYIVKGRVSEGSGPNREAECTASFRVVGYQPPTISCSANPSNILPGGLSTITATARSPQNRPLNYSFGTSAGQITANGATATLAAADVPPGTVNVSCNAVDDHGNSASAAATITVATPPPPVAPAPASRKMCSVSFERDRKRPVRVDNEAKACLDDIALELNRQTDAVLVVVGKHDPQEMPEAAAERTLNVKQYMTDEKGIDPRRIEVRTGENTSRTVDNILVPPGATWDAGGTTSFDPSRVQRHGEPYAPGPR